MDLTSGYPYWLINSGLPVAYPKLENAIKTDVVIIGGGISGALTAYYLINAGVNCIIVDARTIGLGSTCASTSLLQYELDKPLSELSKQIGVNSAEHAYRLCAKAIDTLKSISNKLKFNDFKTCDSLFFAKTKKDVSFLEREFLSRNQAGFNIKLMHEKEIKKNYGFSAPAAILSSEGATTDAYMFTHALLKSGIKTGLQVFDRTSIANITYTKKGVKLKTENGHLIHAMKIINATGYEVTEFVDKKIVQLHSTYAVASEPLHSEKNPWKSNTILWNTDDPYLYLRWTKDNRIIIGGRDENYYNPGARDKLIKKKSKQLTKDFLKLFPTIDFIPEFTWTGTFGSTKDALPYIGTYDKTPHTYYALGFGGNGITFSLIAAKIMRDMILGKKNKDASLFSFNR